MKNLFILLVLSFFLSCDDKIDNVISIEQADSHFPVLMKVDDDTIQYIDFPVFKIKKTIDKKIKLSAMDISTMPSIQSYPRVGYSTGTYLLTLREN